MLVKLLRDKFSTVIKRQFQTLVSTSWLSDQISASNKNVRILQASWNDCQDYNYGHIPTAVCFNGKTCRDNESSYKNIFPSPDAFQKYVSENLGVTNESHVVIYDDSSKIPSLDQGARVWFMFKVFGHDKVSVLNGGLFKWEEEKRELETKSPQVEKTNFVAKYRPELMLQFESVLENVETKNFQLVDARVPGRYYGIGLEPHGKAGRIPNSINIPVQNLIDPDTKLVQDNSELLKIFQRTKIDLKKPLTTYCGTGIHACAVILATHLIGKVDTKLYNGSWCEWNQRVPDKLIIK